MGELKRIEKKRKQFNNLALGKIENVNPLNSSFNI